MTTMDHLSKREVQCSTVQNNVAWNNELLNNVVQENVIWNDEV